MLTERLIRDTPPGEKDRILWDAQIKGLGVRIRTSGTKTYILNYRVNGREHRATLARVGEIALREARERAGVELVRIRAGEADPLMRRREARGAPTVNEGLERFFTEFVPARLEAGRLAPRTVENYRQQAARYLRPALGGRRIGDVTRADIERMVERLGAVAPVQRNRVLAFTSRVFRLFEDWGVRAQHTNPVRGIERSREEARDRVLAPSELAALGEALGRAESDKPAAVAAIRFAALTGLRIGEVLAMRWEHVDAERSAVVLPQTKTGRRVHGLPTAALELLAGLPRINGYVFTTGDGAARDAPVRYQTVHAVFAAIVADARLSDVRLHDLRRTVMTSAARAGLGSHVLRDLLGHKTTAMADRYIRHVGAAVHEAQERIGAAIDAQLQGEVPAEVVPLDGRREEVR